MDQIDSLRVTDEELAKLGNFGLVAFAARCASYMIPLLRSSNLSELYDSVELMYGVAAASGRAFQYRSNALVDPKYNGAGPAEDIEVRAADVFRAAVVAADQIALSQTIPGGRQPAMNHWNRAESAAYRAIQQATTLIAEQSKSGLAMLQKDLGDLLEYRGPSAHWHSPLGPEIHLGFFATRTTFDDDNIANLRSIVELSSELGDALLEYFRRHPRRLQHELSPREFEEFIADIWHGLGWKVQLTRLGADGGRDVIAVSSSPSPVRFLIECKRWRRNVGVQVVRALHGVLDDEQANKGIIVTTSGFTKSAMQHLDRHLWRLEGRDLKGIVEWLELLHRSRVARVLGSGLDING